MMKIRHSFEYDACSGEIAAEFCDHDSEYQADTINAIGQQFEDWAQDKTKTATYVQLLEVAEQLNDSGKWFIRTLRDYMSNKEGGKG